ncbi:MAG: EamA family transporter [Lachnospiraceae bacterium]|nr:EamA family transporter [Lachnospiraceae bacterium]
MVWISCVLLYGVLKGVREIFKKKAMVKSTVIEVLVLYTVLSLVMVIATTTAEIAFGDVRATEYLFGLRPAQYAAIAVKSFVIFVAWICGFRALRHMPVSMYAILDMARVVFSAMLGVLVLGERPTTWQSVGLLLVCIGLFLLRFVKEDVSEEEPAKNLPGKESAEAPAGADGENPAEAVAVETGDVTTVDPSENVPAVVSAPEPAALSKRRMRFYVLLAIASCFLNAVSGNMDKALMRDGTMSSGQLQLWYMVFLVAFYVIYTLARKIHLDVRGMLKNPWIWGLSILFVVADRALFIANGIADSKVVVMTVLKQSCSIVTILGGWMVFREKKIWQKLLCAAVVIFGIVLSVR